MGYTVVLPDLRFVKQAGFSPIIDLVLPALSTLLGRANRSTLAPTTSEHWLREQFGAQGVSAALLSLKADLPDAPAGHWLRADPVHLRADRDRAILFDASLLQIEAAEADQLVAALNQLYHPDGYEFVAATASRWYVRLPSQPDLQSSSLAEVSGQDIHAHLPRGPRAMQWHKLLNELQMLLYTQAANDAREQAGKPAINSLWLWGEGNAPEQLRSPYQHIQSNDVLAKGLAIAAKQAHTPLAASFNASQAADGTLVMLDTLSLPARQGDLHAWRDALLQLEQNWFQPLLQAWKGGQLNEVTLLLPGSQQTLQASLQPSDRWKLWRRPVDLGHCLAESA